MKKKVALILLSLLLVVNVCTFSTFADGDDKDHTHDKSIITPMAIGCERCGVGLMLLDDIAYGDWNPYDTYECWYVGCMVTKEKRAVSEIYRCNYCNFAENFIGYEYKETHSIPHPPQ